MDGWDHAAQGQLFKIDFDGEGVVRSVKERVAKKLEEFIGDYSDGLHPWHSRGNSGFIDDFSIWESSSKLLEKFEECCFTTSTMLIGAAVVAVQPARLLVNDQSRMRSRNDPNLNIMNWWA